MTLGLLGVEIGKSSAWANGRSVVALENVVSIGKFVLPHESGNVQAQVELASAHDSISAFRGLICPCVPRRYKIGNVEL